MLSTGTNSPVLVVPAISSSTRQVLRPRALLRFGEGRGSVENGPAPNTCRDSSASNHCQRSRRRFIAVRRAPPIRVTRSGNSSVPSYRPRQRYELDARSRRPVGREARVRGKSRISCSLPCRLLAERMRAPIQIAEFGTSRPSDGLWWSLPYAIGVDTHRRRLGPLSAQLDAGAHSHPSITRRQLP